jgi:hypothetical protein
MRRILAAAAVILAVAFLLLLTNSYVHQRRLERNLPLVHEGMPESDVVGLLGRPDRVARPCWAANRQCSFDYVYDMPWTSFGNWVISFDAFKHVIAKRALYSP